MSIIKHEVNSTTVEQRAVDGFINGTAMAVAHGKKINDWFRNGLTLKLFEALALDLNLEIKEENSRNLDAVKLSASKYKNLFPELIFAKQGSPEAGGGTWVHPDLAIQLAQWCSPRFAIQVSRWVREWMTTGQNPIQPPEPQPEPDRPQLKELPVIMPTPEEIEFMRSPSARSHPNWMQLSGYDRALEAVRKHRSGIVPQ